jgi:hypothetical protein
MALPHYEQFPLPLFQKKPSPPFSSTTMDTAARLPVQGATPPPAALRSLISSRSHRYLQQQPSPTNAVTCRRPLPTSLLSHTRCWRHLPTARTPPPPPTYVSRPLQTPTSLAAMVLPTTSGRPPSNSIALLHGCKKTKTLHCLKHSELCFESCKQCVDACK